MKWKNHRLTTFATVFALTGSVPATIIATASSALPDVLEGYVLLIIAFGSVYGATGNFTISASAAAVAVVIQMKYMAHRKLTHYPWIFLVPAILLWRQMQIGGGYIAYTSFFILIGYILHLLEDFFSKSGIPLVTPGGRSTGLRLYVTHTPSEDVVALSMVACAVVYAWTKGMFNQVYLTQVADNTAIFVTRLIHYSKG